MSYDPYIEQEKANEGKSEDDPDYIFAICDNCNGLITNEEYWRTATDEYCEACPEMCCDPRSKSFGCDCEDE